MCCRVEVGPGRVEHRLATTRLDLLFSTRAVQQIRQIGHATWLVDDNARNGRHMATCRVALEECAFVEDKTVGEESGLREENRKEKGFNYQE